MTRADQPKSLAVVLKIGELEKASDLTHYMINLSKILRTPLQVIIEQVQKKLDLQAASTAATGTPPTS
jgi:hypothetical protein